MWSNIHKFYLPIWLACWSWMQVLVALEPTIGVDQVLHYQPEQVHLSFGDAPSELIVTWSTRSNVDEAIVEYGPTDYTMLANGTSSRFVDGGTARSVQYIHRVRLVDLEPDTVYVYHCGSNYGWSPKFSFHTAVRWDGDWSPRIVLFGDMGNENAQSLPRLQREAQSGMYDAAIHVGDFGYDMHTDNGRVGDEFMRQIESVAAYIPYMVCPGNHEEKYNFSHYRARFSMPGHSENLFYSFDIGPVHFVGFSTEVYYFLNYGLKMLTKQYEWLEGDLAEANRPESRQKRPWIITFGHRPMYCSNNDRDDCTHSETLVRVGWPFAHLFGLEELFKRHGVDVEVWAHEHSYERLWPMYAYQVCNGSEQAPYHNPCAPVHLVTGSAGCKEGRDGFIAGTSPWSAFRSSDYGYTRLNAYNGTHLHFEQVSDDKHGAIIDSFWITKDPQPGVRVRDAQKEDEP